MSSSLYYYIRFPYCFLSAVFPIPLLLSPTNRLSFSLPTPIFHSLPLIPPWFSTSLISTFVSLLFLFPLITLSQLSSIPSHSFALLASLSPSLTLLAALSEPPWTPYLQLFPYSSLLSVYTYHILSQHPSHFSPSTFPAFLSPPSPSPCPFSFTSLSLVHPFCTPPSSQRYIPLPLPFSSFLPLSHLSSPSTLQAFLFLPPPSQPPFLSLTLPISIPWPPSPPPSTYLTSSHSHHAMRVNSRPWHRHKKRSRRVITECCESGSDALDSRLFGGKNGGTDELTGQWRTHGYPSSLSPSLLPSIPRRILSLPPSVSPLSSFSEVAMTHTLDGVASSYALYYLVKEIHSSREAQRHWWSYLQRQLVLFCLHIW